MTTTPTASYNTEEATAAQDGGYPNVLSLLRDKQWVGSDHDILKSITLLRAVLFARLEEAE